MKKELELKQEQWHRKSEAKLQDIKLGSAKIS